MVEYKRWRLDDKELVNLSPARVRDLAVECFFDAQKETVARSKKALGIEATDESIRESVRMMVMMAFQEVGGDYSNPDKATLQKVLEVLARKAKSWRTPDDIVSHHKAQMAKALAALK